MRCSRLPASRNARPRTVAGIDFAFGFPQWHATANGWTCGRDIWRAAYRDGGSWLTCESAPFWGRTTKRLPHPGARLRRTEQAIVANGGSPRSVFQIGGAGAVGTGSIRGMRILHELAEAGFTIWPFDPAGDAAIIETPVIDRAA
jgi:hypothetical protein